MCLTECLVALLAKIRERFWPEYIGFEVSEEPHVESLVCGALLKQSLE